MLVQKLSWDTHYLSQTTVFVGFFGIRHRIMITFVCVVLFAFLLHGFFAVACAIFARFLMLLFVFYLRSCSYKSAPSREPPTLYVGVSE